MIFRFVTICWSICYCNKDMMYRQIMRTRIYNGRMKRWSLWGEKTGENVTIWRSYAGVRSVLRRRTKSLRFTYRRNFWGNYWQQLPKYIFCAQQIYRVILTEPPSEIIIIYTMLFHNCWFLLTRQQHCKTNIYQSVSVLKSTYRFIDLRA
jgi:hypothetical protein